MEKQRDYPSDLKNAEWELIRHELPAPKARGRRRRTDLRAVVNAIFYLLDNGCKWRALPHDYPKWQVVYAYFRAWQKNGLWTRLNDQLREQVRQQNGREAQPSGAILDAQSVKTTKKGGRGATTLAKK